MVDCAIIGCSQIAGGYDIPDSNLVRTHAKAYLENQNCNLIAVCDIQADMALRFADTWRATHYFKDHNELFRDVKPDIVSICTPTNQHETVFYAAIDAGIPYIWLEKPAAESIRSVEKMAAKAADSKSQIWMNYFRRYDAGFKKIKKRIGLLGEFQCVNFYYTKGLRHNGSHVLDLLYWYFGDFVDVKISSIFTDREYPTVSATINMEKATINLIGLDHRAYEVFELDIIGKKGRIKVLDGGQTISFWEVTGDKYYKGYKNLIETERHWGTYGTFMRQGLQAGLGGKTMPGLVNELKIQKIIENISKKYNISL